MSFSISFQYIYVPKPIDNSGFIQYTNQYNLNNFSTIFIFFLYLLSQPFSSLYYGKTLFQLRKNREKTAEKGPKNDRF